MSSLLERGVPVCSEVGSFQGAPHRDRKERGRDGGKAGRTTRDEGDPSPVAQAGGDGGSDGRGDTPRGTRH